MEKVFGLPTTELAIVMASLLVVIFFIIVIGAIRRFILVKMGTRNIPRRKGQSILIVIGLMLSSAIIATSLGIGDTVRYSVRSVALDFLGPTDEIIEGPGRKLFGEEYFNYSEFERIEQLTQNNSDIEALLPLIEINLPASNDNLELAESNMRVRGVDGDYSNNFDELENVQGEVVSINSLAPYETYINADASEVLKIDKGENISVYTQSGKIELKVFDVLKNGGLFVIGTERHESRRIDNQLRGRSGRQGDPGSSRFYVSLEDEVMRRFGGDRVKGIMEWAGFSEDAPIENRLVSKSIEASQTKVESFHFEIRKNLVEYDDVANMHRSVIYAERNKVLTGADLKTNISEMIHREISGLITQHLQDENSDNWEIDAFLTALATIFPEAPSINRADLFNMHQDEIDDALISYADNLYESREANVGPENMRTVERLVMLRTIDSLWVQHLTSMENLRQGIGLQAFGQRDPLVMFKREGHEMFQDLLGRIQTDIVHTIFRANIDNNRNTNNTPKRTIETPISKVAGRQRQVNTMVGGNKIGRNNPCPCGSGKKYKRCHGMAA